MFSGVSEDVHLTGPPSRFCSAARAEGQKVVAGAQNQKYIPTGASYKGHARACRFSVWFRAPAKGYAISARRTPAATDTAWQAKAAAPTPSRQHARLAMLPALNRSSNGGRKHANKRSGRPHPRSVAPPMPQGSAPAIRPIGAGGGTAAGIASRAMPYQNVKHHRHRKRQRPTSLKTPPLSRRPLAYVDRTLCCCCCCCRGEYDGD